MNAAPFPGNGMRDDTPIQGGYRAAVPHDPHASLGADIAEDFAREMTGALDEALAGDEPIAGVMLIETKREILERFIQRGRVAMAEKRNIIAKATAEFRQLKASVRADEDALDSLLASEA